MNIKIIACLGIGIIMAAPAIADDGFDDEIEYQEYFDEDLEEDSTEEEVPAPRAVSARLTCPEINQRVEDLQADVKAYPELADELEKMLARQRAACAPRANRRPVHNYGNVNPVVVFEETEPVTEVETPKPVPEPKPEPIVVEKTPEELAAEQLKIEENRAKGLCDDGVKPNKYGCCVGEKFKEVSQMKFACCPTEGDGECIEPRNKK